MSFNSWTYLYFLAIVLPVYYCLTRRAQNVFLLGASYVFYGWWDWRFLSLLWISTIVDFLVGRKLDQTPSENHRARKHLLLLSLVTNLGLLGFFKYANFFVDSAREVLDSLGVDAPNWTLHVILPVGISFYTFQTLAYTIDVYRGRIRATNSLLDFALYVAFFPQLVAGPIERAQHLLPAFAQPRRVTGADWIGGLGLIFVGLVRKIAVADFLAGTVSSAFASPESGAPLQLLIGLYGFALLIYGDFAGYTDIARGTARLLGIDLMLNFHRPYAASSITEFWHRWHISLSTWLRDYLYIPLGGNRHGRLTTYRNLMLTMLLGGLWHGASWRFVVWGGLHGLFLAVHKFWLELKGLHPPRELPAFSMRQFFRRLPGTVVTFHLVCLTWIFFRAESFADSFNYLTGILNLREYQLTNSAMIALHRLLMAGGVILLIDGSKAILERWQLNFADLTPTWQGAALGAAIVVLLLMGDRVYAPFIYFQF